MQDCWHNERKQLGTDYNSISEVAIYDQRMRQFRDVDAENTLLIQLAAIHAESRVLEIGTGTGAFARSAAKIARSVNAIDISQIMLDYAASKAREEQLTNLTTHCEGFLSFPFSPGEYDAIVTSLALHHLSDVWKSIALRRIYNALKPGGKFILADVVFDWKEEDPATYFERIMEAAPQSRTNFGRHIADELSTTTWIMEELLKRAGFMILSDHCNDDFFHFYECVK